MFRGVTRAGEKFSTLKNFGKPTYIVAAKRTPIGSFMGKLSKMTATDLGGLAIKAAIESIKLDPKAINEVLLGNVVSAGIGQAPARQAAIKGGVDKSVPCTTVNKVCSSGMKTIMLGAQSIGLGLNDVVLAGGFESMSNAPFYVTNHRKGTGFGDQKLLDSLSFDGLTDSFNNIAMGVCAEKTVTDFKMTRQHQDDFTVASYSRVIEATKEGRFKDQIVPIQVDKEILAEDEEYKRFNKQKLASLKPVFSKTGSITAANASKINDGACAVILMSEDKVKELQLKPLAKIIAYADAEIDPIDFCIAPFYASKKALSFAGIDLSKIDYFEFNEAFAATVLANLKLMSIGMDKVNVNGGAVALGHPIGMSGARIVQSLMTVLQQKKAKYGLAGICNGGGGASAIIIENLRL